MEIFTASPAAAARRPSAITAELFPLTLSGTFTKLHDFDSGDGTPPAFLYALVQGSDGNFYGLSRDGGSTDLNEGTFFRISPDGNTVTELFAFHSGNGPGYSPQAQLLVGNDGNFYGLTSSGGATGGAGANGTIFMATEAGAVTPLHLFTGSTAPRNHTYPLMQGTDGNLYGVSANGGQHDFGTIYRYNLSDGSFTVLHEFQDPTIDGSSPFCTLVQGSDGNFYGSTGEGFPPDPASLDLGNGSYFQLTPAGGFTTIAKTDGADEGPTILMAISSS